MKRTLLWLHRLNQSSSYQMDRFTFQKVAVVDDMDIHREGSRCVLGGPVVEEYDPEMRFPIIFQQKFHEYVHNAKLAMGVQDRSTHKNIRPYMVVHWRRGDQLKTRCKPRKNGGAPVDQSYNCGSAKSLITEINRVLDSGYIQGDKAHEFYWREEGNKAFRKSSKDPLPVVYISTNQDLRVIEDGKAIKDYFREAGFKTFKDTGLKLNDLDEFTTELCMMVDADFFMAWGRSSIHDFVGLAYDQKKNPHKYNFVRAKTPNEISNHCTSEVYHDLKFRLGLNQKS